MVLAFALKVMTINIGWGLMVPAFAFKLMVPDFALEVMPINIGWGLMVPAFAFKLMELNVLAQR
jgi:hypothetical protein